MAGQFDQTIMVIQKFVATGWTRAFIRFGPATNTAAHRPRSSHDHGAHRKGAHGAPGGQKSLSPGVANFLGARRRAGRWRPGSAAAVDDRPQAIDVRRGTPAQAAPRPAVAAAELLFHGTPGCNESGRGWNKTPITWNKNAGLWTEKRVARNAPGPGRCEVRCPRGRNRRIACHMR